MLVVVAVGAWTLFGPRTYSSEGKLLVRLGRENATLDPTATMGQEPTIVVPTSRTNEINSAVAILQSRVLLEKVVDCVGPEPILEGYPSPEQEATDDVKPSMLRRATGSVSALVDRIPVFDPLSDRDRAILKLAKGLEVEAVQDSNVIRIAYAGKSPKLCQDVVASVIEAYLAEHARLSRPSGSEDFLQQQTERVRKELAEAEQALRDLKDTTGIVAPEEQRLVLVEQIGRLEEEVSGTVRDTVTSQAKVGALREKLASLPQTQMTEKIDGIDDDGTNRVRSQFYTLQVREKEMSARYTEAHPKLQEVRRQAAEAKKILDAEKPSGTHITTAPNRKYETAELALLEEEPVLASLQAKVGTVRAQLVDVRGQLKQFNEDEFRLVALARKVDLCDAEYRRYAVNLEQARIDEALELQSMSNISIVQPATLEMKPIRPRKLVNLVLALLVGSAGGVGLALVAESLDDSVDSPEDIEAKLDLPAIASIPRMRKRDLVLDGRS